MNASTLNLKPLFYWITNRESIRLAKEAGDKPPFTSDPILAKYRFCNVRREDDLVTRWIDTHIRKPFADHPNLFFMLCIARQINWPPMLQFLIDNAWPHDDQFEPVQLATALDYWQRFGNKVYTGAYMISAPATKGASKNAYIANEVLGNVWRNRHLFANLLSLQHTHRTLTQFKGWGPFMAYQAVVDTRFTKLLDHAPDISTWAAAGPGTIRGLNRLLGYRAYEAPMTQGRALGLMQEIFPQITPATGVELDFSDVPNVLCETDKYLRVKLGQGKPRALYIPGRGS